MQASKGPIPQFAYRSNNGLLVSNGPPDNSLVEGFSSTEDVRVFEYSPDGRYLAWVLQDRVKIFDASTNSLVQEISQKNVIEIEFSPRGTFVSTWERLVKNADSETNPHKNLIVWEVTTGKQLISFTQKNQSGWNVDWTAEETYFARLVSNEVQFYNPKEVASGVCARLKHEGIADFSLSPGKRLTVAAFIPEKKGQPAAVRLYDFANLNTPLSQKSFYRADSVQFNWNKLGTNVLVFTHTDVDKTGQSYYGETNLYYLSITGNFDCKVELDKAGPIHDVTWSPNAKEFVVVYGSMPAKATLFDHRANAIYDFGSAARNTVKFNAHGRLLFIGGFGNLAGDMDIWDRKTFKKLATVHAANSSSSEWCPDGRHIMTATLYKRLKVDNGIKLWHYTGVLVHSVDVKEMYQVGWRTSPAEFWPEIRSLSPPPQSSLTAPAAPAKPMGVYRPPGARGSATPSFFKDRSSDAQPRSNGSNSSAGIPGQAPAEDKMLSKAAAKNKKKREAKKKDDGSSSPAEQPPVPEPATSSQAASDLEKKHKTVSKKLKQISDIKAKIQAGEKVELTQIKKAEGEAAVREELETIRRQMEQLGIKP
ncbi:hypothetical protein PhCBS80983_g00066 [Powellomyces hirtus]|uniref:Eukaryotic translation initiation factor 2A n=1 Tax=Powellomyces hirtus TaxID=109895 RepID=A0A507EGP4_9FUNG|nr:hypothetical protein PhCBS80983_g00066 [Powellomyces hirtus]